MVDRSAAADRTMEYLIRDRLPTARLLRFRRRRAPTIFEGRNVAIDGNCLAHRSNDCSRSRPAFQAVACLPTTQQDGRRCSPASTAMHRRDRSLNGRRAVLTISINSTCLPRRVGTRLPGSQLAQQGAERRPSAALCGRRNGNKTFRTRTLRGPFDSQLER
jgi:hypothetical protein